MTRSPRSGTASCALLLAAASWLLLAAAPQAARAAESSNAAANPCALARAGDADDADYGFGGTGAAPSIAGVGDEDGVGGTGNTARGDSLAAGDDESGFGGTGLETTGFGGDDDSGMGGTGVLGTITGFASVCVNGLEIHYDANVAVEVDGVREDLRALREGQVVVVNAGPEPGAPGELRTTAIAVRHAVRGPIAAIDHDAGELTLLRQTVELVSGARVIDARGNELPLASLESGDIVAISGLRSGGRILATLVERRAADSLASLVGPLGRSDSGEPLVAGVRIEPEVLAPASDLAAAPAVMASGHWNAVTGTLEGARVAPALRTRELTSLSLEGYVEERLAGGRLSVGGIEVDLGERPEAGARPGGEPEERRVDEHIIVYGQLRDGVLWVERVSQLRPRRMWLPRPSDLRLDRVLDAARLRAPRPAADGIVRPKPLSVQRPPDIAKPPPRPPRPPPRPIRPIRPVRPSDLRPANPGVLR